MAVNTDVQDDKAVHNEVPWHRGIEKMLAAAPAGMRGSSGTEGELTDYLLRLLRDGEGCRSSTWTRVFSHSGTPGEYSGRACTNSCQG